MSSDNNKNNVGNILMWITTLFILGLLLFIIISGKYNVDTESQLCIDMCKSNLTPILECLK